MRKALLSTIVGALAVALLPLSALALNAVDNPITISNLSSVSSPIGTLVYIYGSGFTPTGNTINFGIGVIPNVSAFLQPNGVSFVTFTVPGNLVPSCASEMPPCPVAYTPVQGGNSYNLSVSNANGISNTVSFMVTATIPTVTSYPFPSPTITLNLPLPTASSTPAPIPVNSWVPLPSPTPLAGSPRLVKSNSSPNVYYITDSGYKKMIPNIQTFYSYGNHWSDVVTVDQSVIDSKPSITLIRGVGSQKVYEIQNGKKRWITSAGAFQRNGFSWDQIAPVNATELNAYPNGSPIN